MGEMAMRAIKFFVVAAASLALLTAPVAAQMRGKGAKHNPAAAAQSAEQRKKTAEAEKAYQATLKTIPDQKFDPWAKMR
jgi:hypothetical protein